MHRSHTKANKLWTCLRTWSTVNLSLLPSYLKIIVCGLFLSSRQIASFSPSLNCNFFLLALSSHWTPSTEQWRARFRNCTAAKGWSALKRSAGSLGTVSPFRKWDDYRLYSYRGMRRTPLCSNSFQFFPLVCIYSIDCFRWWTVPDITAPHPITDKPLVSSPSFISNFWNLI